MGTVQLSAIDGQVYMGLGNLTQQQLDPSIEQQERDHEIAADLTDLNISHQNHRCKLYSVTLNQNTNDYPMPADFGNAVYAQYRPQGNAGIGCWNVPVDIVNLVNLQQRTDVGYPAVAFFGSNPVTARVSCFSWNLVNAPLVLEILYDDSTLPSSVDQAVVPIQDLFVPRAVCNIQIACLDHAEMIDTKRENLRKTLTLKAQLWNVRWSQYINRSPSQGPIHRMPFNQGRTYQPIGSWYWL